MQRYKIRCNDCDPKITPHENGKWVRWGDVERLRAELAERKATTPAPKPDCRTCAHVYTDMESYGCKRSITTIVCIKGDGYVPSLPVRLYETGGE
jgi:hypothetical protein